MAWPNNFDTSNMYSNIMDPDLTKISAPTISAFSTNLMPQYTSSITDKISSMDFTGSDLSKYGLKAPTALDISGSPATEEKGFFDNIFDDKYKMGNIVGLAGALTQLASMPTMMKNARLQNEALRQNIDTAKEEQARRNKNISSFNAPRSAFA